MQEYFPHLTNSLLEVTASGIDAQVILDLQLPEGRSIAELLNDQKTQQEKDPTP